VAWAERTWSRMTKDSNQQTPDYQNRNSRDRISIYPKIVLGTASIIIGLGAGLIGPDESNFFGHVINSGIISGAVYMVGSTLIRR